MLNDNTVSDTMSQDEAESRENHNQDHIETHSFGLLKHWVIYS